MACNHLLNIHLTIWSPIHWLLRFNYGILMWFLWLCWHNTTCTGTGSALCRVLYTCLTGIYFLTALGSTVIDFYDLLLCSFWAVADLSVNILVDILESDRRLKLPLCGDRFDSVFNLRFHVVMSFCCRPSGNIFMLSSYVSVVVDIHSTVRCRLTTLDQSQMEYLHFHSTSHYRCYKQLQALQARRCEH